MLETASYNVNFSCDNSKTMFNTTNSTTVTFSLSDLLNDALNVSCEITIVAINSEGMSSLPSSKVFGEQLSTLITSLLYNKSFDVPIVTKSHTCVALHKS